MKRDVVLCATDRPAKASTMIVACIVLCAVECCVLSSVVCCRVLF
jgi:hypothetical protein